MPTWWDYLCPVCSRLCFGLCLRSHGSDGSVAEACSEGGVEPGRDGRLRLLGLDLDRVLPTPEVLAGPHPGRQRMTREPPDCPICARKAAPEHCEWSQESREIVTSSAFGSRKEIVAVAVCAFRCWMCGTRGLEHVEPD